MKTILAAAIALLIGGVAIAQETYTEASVEARLDRIERAIARLEQKLAGRGGGGMMEGCRDMMGGGMMGGGEMRGTRGSGAPSPNDQWRSDPAR